MTCDIIVTVVVHSLLCLVMLMAMTGVGLTSCVAGCFIADVDAFLSAALLVSNVGLCRSASSFLSALT